MTNPTTITAQPGLPYLDTIREFDAPIDAVFRAHTDAELFARWTGPRSMQIDMLRFDATSGGGWEYTAVSGDGYEFGFRGVFHTVAVDALIVQTFEFSGAPGMVGVGSTTFERIGDRTRIVSHEVYPTVEARDMAVATGMESGMIESYERLDELLAG